MIYNDLVEKSLQLTFVGGWNFKKAELINQDPQMRQAIKKLNEKNYVTVLWDMAGGGPPPNTATL